MDYLVGLEKRKKSNDFFFLFDCMKKIIEIVLVVIAAISSFAFMAAGGFMIVYYKAGMIREYGQEFTTVTEYVFAFGWMIPIAILTYMDTPHWKNKVKG